MQEPELKRNVYLVNWTPDWRSSFEVERDLLKTILSSLCIEVHHIGSTAVKGIKAKPIVDILVVVSSHKALDRKTTRLIELGYEVKGENGIKDRRYFQKNVDGKRAFHIHAFEEEDSNIASHLKFRDTLQKFPEIAGKYEQLKMELAEKYKFDKPAYTEGKSSFIQQIIKDSNC